MLFDYCVCVHLSKAIVSYEPIIIESKREILLYTQNIEEEANADDEK